MLSHHTTHLDSVSSAAEYSAETEALSFLQGLHALLEQQLREIELVAATFDYKKLAGFTGMLAGGSAPMPH
jgi:hypothetical protein